MLCKGAHTLFNGQIEKERERVRKTEREREREKRVRKTERDSERVFIFKRNDGCLGTFLSTIIYIERANMHFQFTSLFDMFLT
jgi:hypothetical protein